jgi:hypothetical protein
MGIALIFSPLLLIYIGKKIFDFLDWYQARKIRKRKEKMFFDRNQYATVLTRVMEGESSKWS